jgi:outer membrane protein, heavy metal efflux system
MHAFLAAASAVALAATASAQVGGSATTPIGRPTDAREPALSGPPTPPAAWSRSAPPRSEPLPTSLTLSQALEEAEARSPAIIAARAAVDAAEARVRQAGFRSNPELSVEVENFAGTGELSGLRRTETTVAINQRLDLGGRRRARVSVAQGELAVQRLRLAAARADLAQGIREQFARAATARDRLRVSEEKEERARELARIAGILVDAGREPPLRALRARSAAAQATAELAAARAEEQAARGTLASLFGVTTPPDAVAGSLLDIPPRAIDPEQSLEVRIAEAERLVAEAALQQELAGRRLDPSVGLGVRHVREAGDVALVAGFSMPLQVFDRNQGNIGAARANVVAAEARLAAVMAMSRVRVRNAIITVEAAQARVEALATAAIPEAAEALRLTQLSYQAGRASLLELLDAQDAYTAAQSALIDARLAQALATAELGRVSAQ